MLDIHADVDGRSDEGASRGRIDTRWTAKPQTRARRTPAVQNHRPENETQTPSPDHRHFSSPSRFGRVDALRRRGGSRPVDHVNALDHRTVLPVSGRKETEPQRGREEGLRRAVEANSLFHTLKSLTNHGICHILTLRGFCRHKYGYTCARPSEAQRFASFPLMATILRAVKIPG